MSDGGGVVIDLKADDRQVAKALDALWHNLSPPEIKEVLDEIGASNVTETQMRFEAETDPQGRPWQGLAASTLQKRRQANPRILRDQANLYDSITHRVGSNSAEVGTNRVYARIHQLGGVAGRGKKTKIPARPYLGVSREGQKEILAIVEDRLASK